MTDRQITHAPGCWSWGAKHYDCAVREIERLAAQLTAETSNARGEVEYEYEVWQHGAWQAGGRENDYASAQSEANHYAMMYAQDGPVEVRIYEKRLLSADKVQPKRRRYDPSGSLSEYGIFPECDAQPLEEGEALRDLIGKPVRIEWRRPEDDWPTFTLLAYEPPMVRLQGRDDGEWKHKGDTFWVNVAEIVSIVPDKESTDEA